MKRHCRSLAAPLLAIYLLSTPSVAAAQLVTLLPFAGTRQGGLVDGIIKIINALLLLAAIAAVVYIIISGVRYFSSQGDEDAARQAKLALIYGVIGILVILLAVVIIRFFSANITG